jgi:nucleotide-binding universal stress UspA family protein
MARFRKLVVGVDLARGGVSEGARLAVEQARWLAGRQRAHVTLVHSWRADERWDPDDGQFVQVPPDEEQSRSVLGELMEELRSAGIEAELVLSDETPWLAIVHQVQREQADLVLVGKRSQQQNDGRPLGSVSQSLLRKCPGPVWVFKPGSELKPNVVLAACERTDLGLAILETAASLAEGFGAELHAVHALQLSMSHHLEGGQPIDEFEAEQGAAYRAEVAARLEAIGFAGRSAIHVGITSPTRAVLDGVRKLGAGLVVMGTVSRGGLPGLILGNTAERLLGCLDCSMLVLKPDDFVAPALP